MKKKSIIIAAIILVVLIAGLIIGLVNYNQYTRLFKDTDYPVSYKYKNGNIILTVKDKSDSDIAWTATIADPDYAAAEIKGKASAKKMKCIISPTAAGITTISFTKTADAAGIAVDKTRIDFPVYISETPEGLVINFVDEGTLIEGNDVLGAGTDYPVILCGNYVPYETEEELGIFGNIDFVKGKSDWNIETDSEGLLVYLNESEDTERCYAFLAYTDNAGLIEDDASGTDSVEKITGTIIDPAKEVSSATDATSTSADSVDSDNSTNATNTTDTTIEEKGSGIINLSSSSLGISVKKKVTFYTDGHMTFEPAEEQK